MTTIFPRWKNAVIAGVAIVSSIHAVYFIQNASFDREASQIRTGRLKKELVETRDKLANHDPLSLQLNEMRGSLARLEERLPKRLDLHALEASVRAQASLAHVEITRLRFGASVVQEGFYVDTPLRLAMQGTTAGFFAFMDQMSRASPLQRVVEMKVEANDDSTTAAEMTVMFESLIDEGP